MGRRRNRTRRNQPPPRRPRRPAGPSPHTPAPGHAGAVPTAPDEDATAPRRLAAQACGWCGGPIAVKSTGRLPKWCSQSCRQRAWEQSRAAASGLAAVRVVERWVEMPTPIVPRRQDWPRLLGDLARQLEAGRIYDRDLLALAEALNAVHAAYSRRPFVRNRAGR
jgi:hypothetical protein